MKMNSAKYHIFVLGKQCEHMWAKVGDDSIWESRSTWLKYLIYNWQWI